MINPENQWEELFSKKHILSSKLLNKLGLPVLRTILTNSLITKSFSTCFSIFFLFSFSTNVFFFSLDGCCSVSCLVSIFSSFLSGNGTASDFSNLTFSCFLNVLL